MIHDNESNKGNRYTKNRYNENEERIEKMKETKVK